jgi:dipeptidyl aminopeptidase/acylaminoacyl peptidase
VRQSNPITYISKDDPPFLLQKGSEDCVVPFAQSTLLADALKSAGLKVQFDKIEGAGHGDMGSPVPRFLAEENVEKLLEFARGVFTMP